MPKKVRPGSKRLPPWQTPQTQCRGSYSRKMSKKGVFEQAKDTFSHLAYDQGAMPAFRRRMAARIIAGTLDAEEARQPGAPLRSECL